MSNMITRYARTIVKFCEFDIHKENHTDLGCTLKDRKKMHEFFRASFAFLKIIIKSTVFRYFFANSF